MGLTIDEATGMPALPEEYYWRVQPGSLGSWHIGLVRKRKRFWDKEIAGRTIANPIDFREDSSLARKYETFEVYLATWAAELYEKYLDEKLSYRAAVEKYVGTYPPKKLEW